MSPTRLLILLCLLLSTNLTKASPVLVESILAIVDNNPILLSEFNQMWKTLHNSLNNVNPKEINTLKQRTLDELISLKLQLKQADRLGIRVSQRELNDYIEQIAQNNQLSLKQLYEKVEIDGQTAEQFRESIRNQATIRTLQQRLLAGSIQIRPKQIEAELQKELTINDPHEYQYQILLVENSEDINIKSKIAKKIKTIQKRLKNKLSFEQAIAIYSDLPANDNLNWSEASSIPDNFHDFLLSAKINEISPVIETARGSFLLKLLAKRNKSPIEQIRYQLQIITMSHLSYDQKSAEKIYKLFLKKSTNKNKNTLFGKLAREISQDQFSFKEGKTDWLAKGDFPLKLASQLDRVELNQLHFLETNEGWLIYQVLKREKFDASKVFLRQQIQQRLINKEMEKSYAGYLRNLRKNSSVKVLVEFNSR